MANFYGDNEDLRWYLEKGIDWEPIVTACEFGLELEDGFRTVDEAREFYLDIVTMFGEFVAEEIAPHTAEIDREGVLFENGEARFPPRLAGIFDRMRELDVHGMCLPRELGGVNAPILLYNVHNELLGRVEQAVMTHYSFHAGMALAMLALSIDEGTTELDREGKKIVRTRFAEAIDDIARGEAWGCMDITEPDAGSDMAALRVTGEQNDDGEWTLTGQKIFVTSGHGKYHFVIARTEKAEDAGDPFAGLGGLSMFLVKTYDDDDVDGRRIRHAKLDRIEDKRDPKRDFAHAQLHAERLTALMAEAAICRILLDQASKHPERCEVLARYFERAEPRCSFLADQIDSTGGRLLAELAEPVAERTAS